MANLVPEDDLPQINYVPEDDLPVPTKISNPTDFKDIAERPSPYTMSPQNMALAGLLGSTFGGAYAKLGKAGGNAALAALEGGVTGVGSSAVGELIKEATDNSNVGQLAALGAEVVSGAALPLARDLITRVPTAALMASVGYAKAKTAQALTGESASSRIAKNKIFGSETVKAGATKTNYREAFEETTAREMADQFGLQVPKGAKSQDVLRDSLYSSINNLDKAGFPLEKTPSGTRLIKLLKDGVKEGEVKPEDVKTIQALLKSQSSSYAPTKDAFETRLLNTAQQATKEFNGVKISDGAAGMLKNAIDDYVGKPYYKTLKDTEKARFTAQSMDDIPVLLEKGFSGDFVEDSIKNISRSPEGVGNFKVALSSYLRSLPEKEALSEWNRLYSSGILTRTKVMDLPDVLRLNRRVKQYTEKGYLKKAGDISGHALKMALVTGVLPSEVAGRADIFNMNGNTTSETSNFKPLDIFRKQ